MAVTRNPTLVRLGAPGDAVTLESPQAHSKISAIFAYVGTTPGVVIVNDKADGSGVALYESYLKSNSGLLINPDDGMWCQGGYKSNASNPTGTVVLVYEDQKD